MYETRTKAITPTNHKTQRQFSESIRIWSNYATSAGKCTCAARMQLSLAEKVARVLSTNHTAKQSKTKANANYFRHSINRGYYTVARRYEFYVRVPREHKIHMFELTCNVLFIIWRLNKQQTRREKSIQQKQKAGIVTSLNDTTLTKVSGPGWSGVWNLRVV